VKIKGIDKAVITHKVAYTVLDEAGDYFARYGNYYDKFHSLSDISGKLFDAAGKVLKSIKKKDISDAALNDGESLITDARIKHFSFYYKTYPYTVEYEDEVGYDGIFAFQPWYPLDDEEMSVEFCKLTIETPADYQLRYKQFNYNGQPVIEENKNKVYIWQVKNIKASESEIYQPAIREVQTAVYYAPIDFEYAGYKGNMKSWQNLGNFFIELNKGRDVLPDNIKADVHRLTNNIKSAQEKVKVLYEYMQSNTHYVGIQLGIGGMQPFEAKYVAEKKYGDCKALSNYMVSLLKEAGIPAHYVLVKASKFTKSVIEDFPTDYFNHVVACVPNGKDSIWLECTSQTVSAGYMGTSTGNRKALLIADDGGHIVSTPSYRATDNLMVRKIDAVVDINGNIIMDINTKFTGFQQEQTHGLLYGATKEEKDKYLNSRINLPTYKVEKNDYKETKGAIPVIDEYLKITAPNYASITGKRLFITPNFVDRERKLPGDKPRKFDIEITYAYRDIDTINIKIPDGYTVEALPKEINITNQFGKFSSVVKVGSNTIILYRLCEINSGYYPASAYEAFAKFYEEMAKADNSKVVLVKNE
jgi:Domain of Unknown Function with PDB structure (DUF3857)/Transglutaminase-like superfamily/Domain of Unknown Function with PDB structure (DUF3858)